VCAPSCGGRCLCTYEKKKGDPVLCYVAIGEQRRSLPPLPPSARPPAALSAPTRGNSRVCAEDGALEQATARNSARLQLGLGTVPATTYRRGVDSTSITYHSNRREIALHIHYFVLYIATNESSSPYCTSHRIIQVHNQKKKKKKREEKARVLRKLMMKLRRPPNSITMFRVSSKRRMRKQYKRKKVKTRSTIRASKIIPIPPISNKKRQNHRDTAGKKKPHPKNKQKNQNPVM